MFERKRILLFLTMFLLTNTGCTNTNVNNKIEPESQVKYSSLRLGIDNTELSAKLTIMTNRTDLIQDKPNNRDFPDYISDFNKLYPNISIMYQGISDYEADMKDRLHSVSWGDICCIPSTVSLLELSDYFEPIDSYESLAGKYNFVDCWISDGLVYGIPSSGNVQGIIYNKRIWEKAGIKEIPVTPDEFINDLRLIKKNTDSIPLYTNYAARWPLVAWDNYIFVSATGSVGYRYTTMPYEKAPFSDRGNGTGPYAVYNILYSAVSEGLIEPEPSKTSWEHCKADMNYGKIATMALGSWAINQIREAGDNPQDVGYMPFPISINGKQYATSSSDYCYGINKNISDEKKLAAKIYIKYLTERSGFAYDQGSIPILKSDDYPEIYESFSHTMLISNSEDNSEDYSNVNEKSGLMLESDTNHVAEIIDAALSGEKTFDEIAADWNEKWKNAYKNSSSLGDDIP